MFFESELPTPEIPPTYFTSLWETAAHFWNSPDIPWDAKGQYLLELSLLWIGAAVVVGVAAKLLVPGTHLKGTWSTLVVGMIGCTLASVLMRFILVNLLGREMYAPFSFMEIIAGIVLASGVLAVYNLTVGKVVTRIGAEKDEKNR